MNLNAMLQLSFVIAARKTSFVNITIKSFKQTLGVYLDPTLSFSVHYEQVEKKMSTALSRMYAFRRYFSLNVVKTFLSCYVVSIPDYCLMVWSVQSEQKIVKLQHKINRFLLTYFHPGFAKKRTQKNVTINELLERVNLLTISERRKWFLLKFVFKNFQIKIYDTDWFVRTLPVDACCVSRLVVSRCNSETFKCSVKWSATNTWNYFVQRCKPNPIMSIPEFLDDCKDNILKLRGSLFIS